MRWKSGLCLTLVIKSVKDFQYYESQYWLFPRLCFLLMFPQYMAQEPLKEEGHCVVLYECKKWQEVNDRKIMVNFWLEAVKIVVTGKTSCWASVPQCSISCKEAVQIRFTSYYRNMKRMWMGVPVVTVGGGGWTNEYSSSKHIIKII